MNSNSKRIAEALIAVLTKAGACDVQIVQGGKHPRVSYVWNGNSGFYVFSGTPSDSRRGTKNAVCELRKILGLTEPVKRIGARRSRKLHSDSRPVPMPHTITPIPAWQDALIRHEFVRPLLGARIDEAWKRFWIDCMRAAGGESML